MNFDAWGFSRKAGTPARTYAITITCEQCGHRHTLERRLSTDENVHIVCHSCELSLQAVYVHEARMNHVGS